MKKRIVLSVKNICRADSAFAESVAKEIIGEIGNCDSVTLDFSGIVSVGEPFVSELFSVWHKNNPHVVLNIVNATRSVADDIEQAFKAK